MKNYEYIKSIKIAKPLIPCPVLAKPERLLWKWLNPENEIVYLEENQIVKVKK